MNVYHFIVGAVRLEKSPTKGIERAQFGVLL